MSEKNFDIYFDLGSSKIRVSAFNQNNKGQSILIEKNCISDLKSNQINLTEADKIIEEIISELEKKTGEYLDNINIMLDAPETVSINLSLSKKKDGKKITAEDIQYLVQDAKQQILKFNPDKNIIHIVVGNYKVDDQYYDDPPIDVSCRLFSFNIIFICFPKDLIKSLEQLFYKFQISINKVLCSSYTKSLNYKEQFNSFEKIAFFDLGYQKTSVIIYDKSKLKAFNILPVGSNHITKDISKVLNLSSEESENIKNNLNNDISLTEVDENRKIFNDEFLKKSNFSNETLDLAYKIINARIEEILNLSLGAIRFYENHMDINKFKIVLIGQGSKILDNNSIYINEIIPLFEEIVFFPETVETICESGLMLNQGINKQEVVIVPKKIKKIGFFEKLFHFFK